jgi:hypothetical protein
MSQFPKEVENFHKAMQRPEPVQEVMTGLKGLSDYTPDTYSLPGEFGYQG